MKIKTQFRFLVAGIVLVPLLIGFTYVVYIRFIGTAGDRFMPIFPPAYIGITLIGVLIVFVITMSIVITRTIIHSVEILENTTRHIAEGELDLEVDVRGSNEIISLTKSLNKMRQALKEAELRRFRFIMAISHDLKTPLALIKGYAEAIADGVAEDPASRSGAAEIITAKADQLESMINDLLSAVQMDSGEHLTPMGTVNLKVFLQNLAKTWSNDVELLYHTFIHDINVPENLNIQLNERLILRAMENLINNAVRYTPPGSIIRFTAVRTDYSVELCISDNGPGIDKEDLPHIFEMLYRGSSSRREQGMGLGLAIVLWIINYHGWSISVASEKGKGTSFTISIPITLKKK